MKHYKGERIDLFATITVVNFDKQQIELQNAEFDVLDIDNGGNILCRMTNTQNVVANGVIDRDFTISKKELDRYDSIIESRLKGYRERVFRYLDAIMPIEANDYQQLRLATLMLLQNSDILAEDGDLWSWIGKTENDLVPVQYQINTFEDWRKQYKINNPEEFEYIEQNSTWR